MSDASRKDRVRRTQDRKRGDPRGAKPRARRFAIRMDAEISIDERLLTDVLTDDWRRSFYALQAPADVAGHLAFNLVQGRHLSSLDGFADQDPARATMDFDELVTDVVEVEEGALSDAARQVADVVKDAIHSTGDGALSHEQAILALDEVIRYATRLRRSYVDSRKVKSARRTKQR